MTNKAGPRRFILDTDGGVDDALAILYALASPEVELAAITTVHGNVGVDSATRNVLEVLRIGGGLEPPVPIAIGASAPLRRSLVAARDVHGHDGLGGWMRGRADAPSGLRHGESAEVLICRLARQHPGEITLVLVGPSTNAALALRHDPEGFGMLREVVVMAGAIEGPGNITPAAEFNAFADPDALRELVRWGGDVAVPVVMVTLDITSRIVITPEEWDAWIAGRRDERAEFLRTIAAHVFGFYREISGREQLHPHDPLAMAVSVDRTLGRFERMVVDVETTGEITAGMTVADRRRRKGIGPGNLEICRQVDEARFLELFRERVLASGTST